MDDSPSQRRSKSEPRLPIIPDPFYELKFELLQQGQQVENIAADIHRTSKHVDELSDRIRKLETAATVESAVHRVQSQAEEKSQAKEDKGTKAQFLAGLVWTAGATLAGGVIVLILWLVYLYQQEHKP